MADFTGYTAEALEFLRLLPTRDKPWFDEHRKDYQRLIVEPTKAFVVAVGEGLQDQVSPDIQAVPKTNGSIAPINNDLRFSPDKSPYKDNIMLRFWEGAQKKTAPKLMIRLTGDDVWFAVGAPLTDLDRWRDAVGDDATGADLDTALAELGAGNELSFNEEGAYKRVPKPWPADHPRAALLKTKMFQVRWPGDFIDQADTSAFAEVCTEALIDGANVYRWLMEQVGGAGR